MVVTVPNALCPNARPPPGRREAPHRHRCPCRCRRSHGCERIQGPGHGGRAGGCGETTWSSSGSVGAYTEECLCVGTLDCRHHWPWAFRTYHMKSYCMGGMTNKTGEAISGALSRGNDCQEVCDGGGGSREWIGAMDWGRARTGGSAGGRSWPTEGPTGRPEEGAHRGTRAAPSLRRHRQPGASADPGGGGEGGSVLSLQNWNSTIIIRIATRHPLINA